MTRVPSPYRQVLRTPGALRFAVSGFVGRFPMAMMTIAIVLVVRHRTGSYGIAGAASAAHTLTQAAVTPLVGRLVDRFGQSAVVARLLAIFLAGIAILTIGGTSARPDRACSSSEPSSPVPGSHRSVRWYAPAGRTCSRGAELSTALALESSADEAIFILGPIVVTALSAVDPACGAAARRRAGARRHARVPRRPQHASRRPWRPNPDRARGASPPCGW